MQEPNIALTPDEAGIVLALVGAEMSKFNKNTREGLEGLAPLNPIESKVLELVRAQMAAQRARENDEQYG